MTDVVKVKTIEFSIKDGTPCRAYKMFDNHTNKVYYTLSVDDCWVDDIEITEKAIRKAAENYCNTPEQNAADLFKKAEKLNCILELQELVLTRLNREWEDA